MLFQLLLAPVFALAMTKGQPVAWDGEISRFVVRLTLDNGHFPIFCSGALISNSEVITAGHCLLGQAKPFLDRGQVYVEMFDPRSPQGFRRIAIASARSRLLHHIDVAVAVLKEDAGLGAVDFPKLASAPCSKRSPLFTFGFGLDENGRTSDTPRMGIYQQIEGSDEFIAGQSADPEHGRNCFGDSGGPVVCELYGRPVIASVNSRLSPDFVDAFQYLFKQMPAGQLCNRTNVISSLNFSTHKSLIKELRKR